MTRKSLLFCVMLMAVVAGVAASMHGVVHATTLKCPDFEDAVLYHVVLSVAAAFMGLGSGVLLGFMIFAKERDFG
jgi:hypothetical protein